MQYLTHRKVVMWRLVGVLCGLMLLVALPQRGAAQDAKEGAPKFALASGSDLEWIEWSDVQWLQWLLQAEQRVDAKPAARSSPLSEGSWLRLEVDFAGMRVLTRQSPLTEHTNPNPRRRRVGIGVGVTLGIVAFGLAIGAAVAVSSIDRSFE